MLCSMVVCCCWVFVFVHSFIFVRHTLHHYYHHHNKKKRNIIYIYMYNIYFVYIFCSYFYQRSPIQFLLSFFFLWVKNVLEYIIFIYVQVCLGVLYVSWFSFSYFQTHKTTTTTATTNKKPSQKMKEKHKKKWNFSNVTKRRKHHPFPKL